MSLYDKASLTMTPSGVKNAKIYSNKPYGGNGDFTFARSSIATRVNSDGYIENVVVDEPRLNYSIVNGIVQDNPSLLLEPTRTNSIGYSEDFSAWTPLDLTVTDNIAISPDGSLNASKLTLTSGTSNKRIGLGSQPATAVDRSFSFFVKTNNINACQLLHSGDLQGFAYFDLVNNTVGSTGSKTTSKIENYGNGWYRCTAIFDSTNNYGSSVYLYISDDATGTYGGDTSEVGDLLVYGAQYEVGSYPTSYIPTSGSTVPRAAETANGAGTSADFNDSEGVLYAEIAWSTPTTSSNLRIAISDTTANNRVLIQNINHTANKLQFYVIVGGATSTDFSVIPSDITLFNKIAFKYKTNDFSVWINGVKVLTDTSGITFPSGTLTELAFDGGDGLFDWYGNTKEIAAFKEALTDAELESLTSWTSFNAMATGQLYTIK